ncbi:MAG: AEC family transporter [Cyclobacteriaceae bacterium]|nr:AEC family transporter [Cyclobacteriaceae bacterium SS2]
MNLAVTKTISLLLLILIGFFLQKRIINKEQKTGIKEIILSVALPAIIFISLQKVNFEAEMIILPIMAIIFNLAMFFITDLLTVLFKVPKDSSAYRTLKMLVPSLAPGLSCFPFLLEYIGEETLANAALADIGNKIFLLIILYMISIRWYFQVNKIQSASGKSKLKSLIGSMVSEPVNFVIFVAVFMLALGINYEVFPDFLRMAIDRLSIIMTPLILLFIGISVRFDWQQIKTIWSILLTKAAVAFLLSGVVILIFGVTDPAMVLLIILFPQSSFSFWPFAHMSAVAKMEKNLTKDENGKTFDLDLAMNVLAFSLPFSTIVILTICTFSESVAADPYFSITTGIIFLLIAMLRPYTQYLKKGIIYKHQTNP